MRGKKVIEGKAQTVEASPTLIQEGATSVFTTRDVLSLRYFIAAKLTKCECLKITRLHRD